MLQKVNHVLKEVIFWFSVEAIADFILIALCVWEEALRDLAGHARVLCHRVCPCWKWKVGCTCTGLCLVLGNGAKAALESQDVASVV